MSYFEKEENSLFDDPGQYFEIDEEQETIETEDEGQNGNQEE